MKNLRVWGEGFLCTSGEEMDKINCGMRHSLFSCTAWNLICSKLRELLDWIWFYSSMHRRHFCRQNLKRELKAGIGSRSWKPELEAGVWSRRWKPEMEAGVESRIWKPELGNPSWTTHLKAGIGSRSWEPEMDDEFGSVIWKPELEAVLRRICSFPSHTANPQHIASWHFLPEVFDNLRHQDLGTDCLHRIWRHLISI